MDIEVPSNWQVGLQSPLSKKTTAEGNRDVPVYTNIQYPFDPVRHFTTIDHRPVPALCFSRKIHWCMFQVSPPRAPKDNFVGTYALLFSLPAQWCQARSFPALSPNVSDCSPHEGE